MKKGYKIALGVISVLIVSLTILAIYHMRTYKVEKEPITIQILDTISEYDYSINDRASEYYKSEFEKLKEILNADEIDNEAYSEQVARMFVIDLYSIKTKVNKYDIGGIQFFHTDKQNMHERKITNTLYDLLEDDSYGDRKQELPLVNNVNTVSIKETKYLMGEEKVDAYEIELNWTYEKDLGYDNKGIVIVTKDGIKQSVVSYKPLNEEEKEDSQD